MLDADYVLTDNLIKRNKKNFVFRKNKIFGLKINIYNKIFNTVIKENYPKKFYFLKSKASI